MHGGTSSCFKGMTVFGEVAQLVKALRGTRSLQCSCTAGSVSQA